MNFKTATEGHAALMGAYLSGNYKVVRYGKSWFAYVKGSWAKNWGMSCFHASRGGSVKYSTRLKAQVACNKHYKENKQ